MKGNAKTGNSQHRKIISSIPNSNGLSDIYFFYLSDQSQQFRFTLSIYHISQITPRQLAVYNLKFIGIYIINTVFLLQILSKVGETSRKDSNLITILLQNIHQAIHPFSYWQTLGNFLHYRFVQSFQQCNPLTKTFRKVNFSPHGTFRNCFYFSTYTGTYSKFVNYFGFY